MVAACSYPCNNSYCPVRRVADPQDLLLGSVIFLFLAAPCTPSTPHPLHLPWLIKSVLLCVRKWQVRRTGRRCVDRSGSRTCVHCGWRQQTVAGSVILSYSNSVISLLINVVCLTTSLITYCLTSNDWCWQGPKHSWPISSHCVGIWSVMSVFELSCRYLSCYLGIEIIASVFELLSWHWNCYVGIWAVILALKLLRRYLSCYLGI